MVGILDAKPLSCRSVIISPAKAPQKADMPNTATLTEILMYCLMREVNWFLGIS